MRRLAVGLREVAVSRDVIYRTVVGGLLRSDKGWPEKMAGVPWSRSNRAATHWKLASKSRYNKRETGEENDVQQRNAPLRLSNREKSNECVKRAASASETMMSDRINCHLRQEARWTCRKIAPREQKGEQSPVVEDRLDSLSRRQLKDVGCSAASFPLLEFGFPRNRSSDTCRRVPIVKTAVDEEGKRGERNSIVRRMVSGEPSRRIEGSGSREGAGREKRRRGEEKMMVNASLGVGEWKEALQAGGPGPVVWEGREEDVTGRGMMRDWDLPGIVGWVQ